MRCFNLFGFLSDCKNWFILLLEKCGLVLKLFVFDWFGWELFRVDVLNLIDDWLEWWEDEWLDILVFGWFEVWLVVVIDNEYNDMNRGNKRN